LTCCLVAAIQDPFTGFHEQAASLVATGQNSCRQPAKVIVVRYVPFALTGRHMETDRNQY